MHDRSWVPPEAQRQSGAFTRQQAVGAGATKSEVAWRVRSGLWVPVLGSALRAACQPVDEVLEAHAARLTWPDAVLALHSAARLHRIPVRLDGRVHVVVPHGRPSRGALTPHQYPLDPGDVSTVLGIPVTSPRRTVVDLLGRLPAPACLELLGWVSSRRIVDADELTAWVTSHRRRWGNQARRRAARRLASGAVSPAEERLHQILRRGRVTGWIAGASLLEALGIPAQADVYFPALRLVLEVDGRQAHGPDRFQSDRTRQNMLVAAGCTVLRYTWQDLVEHPSAVLTQVQAMIAYLTARHP